MTLPIQRLRKVFLENITLVILIVGYLAYLLVKGGISDAASDLSLFILLPIWLGVSYVAFSILFDWKLWEVSSKYLFVLLGSGIIAGLVFFNFGFTNEVYVYVPIGVGVGLVLFLVEKVFSIGRK